MRDRHTVRPREVAAALVVPRIRIGRGINLDALIDQIDDPEERNRCSSVGRQFLMLVTRKAGLGDFDEQADITGPGMAARIVIEVTADDSDVWLGLVEIRNTDGLLLANVPSDWHDWIEQAPQSFGDDHMPGFLGHFPHQVAIDQLNPGIIKNSGSGKPLVFIDSHSIKIKRQRPEVGRLKSRAHDAVPSGTEFTGALARRVTLGMAFQLTPRPHATSSRGTSP